MQFDDKDHKHDNEIALAFRNLDARASEKVAELTQQACNEACGVEFHDVFSCLVQDLAASAVAKESQVDEVECDTHQGHKVGASTVGNLARTVNKVNLLFINIFVAAQCFNSILCVSYDHHQEVINRFPEGCSLMIKLHCMSKHFSRMSANRENHNNMLKDNLCLPTNQLDHEVNGTRIAAVCKLMQSALRAKIGIQEHCRQLNLEHFDRG